MNKYKIIDGFIIIFQLSTYLSIFQDIFLGILSQPIKQIIIPCFFSVFLFIRFRNVYFTLSNRFPNFVKLLIVIYLLDIIQLLIFKEGVSGGIFLLIFGILNLLSFYLYLLNTYIYNSKLNNFNEDKIWCIINPYIYFCLYNVFVVLLSVILLSLEILNPNMNELSNSSLINLGNNNIVDNGAIYYFPGFLSINLNITRLSFIPNIGLPTGLSHEPHILCFLILPSLFFIIAKPNYSKITKISLLICYILVCVFSTSATVFLVLLIILFLEFLYVIYVKHNYLNVFFFLIALFVVLYFAKDQISSIYNDFVFIKVKTETDSMDYSKDMINYILKPTSILGRGNIIAPSELKNNSIGLFSSIFDSLIFLLILYQTIKLFLSKNHFEHYVGLGILYFLIHSLKVSYLLFSYPFLIFILTIIFIINNRREKSIIKN